jgi:glycine oxidase
MKKVLVIGAGVVGLSIAYELAKRRHPVVVLERGEVGRESSWAGAGIFPPVNGQTAIHPCEQLEAISTQLHLSWAKELLVETGIDNELQQCGGLYLARTLGEQAALTGLRLYWQEREIAFENWNQNQLRTSVPRLNVETVQASIYAPGDCQVRNPRHLQSLKAACQKLGVRILEHQAGVQLEVANASISAALANGQRLVADQYCIACGAWSERVFEPFGVRLPVTPVRGQVALFRLAEPWQAPIVNEGTRYLVPRSDGHVIAGATIEEVGFDSSTEPQDIADLVCWAESLVADCNRNSLVKAWAGLRPGSYDGLPYIGRVTEESNTLVATGHFKSGLHLSTGTAVVIADLIEGTKPSIDLSPFAVNRGLSEVL